MQSITVARHLSDEQSRVTERRINTTLAHEAGHGLLHAHLFLLDSFPQDLFGDSTDVDPVRVLCRDTPATHHSQGRPSARWWEYQANRMIGTLLLPKSLVLVSLEDLMEPVGRLRTLALSLSVHHEAKLRLSEVFDVNPAVSEIRIGELFPHEDEDQLTL